MVVFRDSIQSVLLPDFSSFGQPEGRQAGGGGLAGEEEDCLHGGERGAWGHLRGEEGEA